MKKIVSIILIAIIIVATTIAINPKPVRAGVWCDIAGDFGYHSIQYNFLCFVEIMMENWDSDWNDL